MSRLGSILASICLPGGIHRRSGSLKGSLRSAETQFPLMKSILSVVPAPKKFAEWERPGAGTADRIR
jgi:hypothetical protein